MAEHLLRLYEPDGDLLGVVVDGLAISYVKRVNDVGLCSFVLNADHEAISTLAYDSIVEVWRRDRAYGVDWTRDWIGLYREPEWASDEAGRSLFTARCVGPLALVSDALVGYAANTSNRSAFAAVAAETIAKNLVKYNATSSGTVVDGRKVAAPVGALAISLETDAARGAVLDLRCAWRNVLEVLQDVAALGAGDIDLAREGAGWKFYWRPGQLGSDKSASVTFAWEYGNMATPRLTRNVLSERTRAIVGGQGEEADRAVVTRDGANYSSSGNRAEMFVDARNQTSTAALQDAGDAALAKLQARDRLAFSVLQTPSTVYVRDYVLGDLVTGRYRGVSLVQKIVSVGVQVRADGRDVLSIGLEEV